MTTQQVKFDVQGLSRDDLSRLTNVLGAQPDMHDDRAALTARGEHDLLTATFIIGLMNATPALIKALGELISDIRKTRYFTIKVTLDDGKTLVEGAATPRQLTALAAALKKLREDDK